MNILRAAPSSSLWSQPSRAGGPGTAEEPNVPSVWCGEFLPELRVRNELGFGRYSGVVRVLARDPVHGPFTSLYPLAVDDGCGTELLVRGERPPGHGGQHAHYAQCGGDPEHQLDARREGAGVGVLRLG